MKSKSSIFRKILRLRGKSVIDAELYKSVLPTKSSRNRHRNNEELSLILNDLEVLELVTRNKSSYKFSQSFLITGRVSIAPNGNGFVYCRLQKEIFLHRMETFHLYDGQTVTVSLSDFFKNRFTGKLVKAEKKQKSFLCVSIASDSAGSVARKVDQADQQIVFIRNQTIEPGVYFNALQNDEVAIHRHALPQFQSHLSSDYVQLLNYDSNYENQDPAEITQRLIHHFNLPTPYQIDNKQADQIQDAFKEALKDSSRIDLREIDTFTIDGETAKDFDDAISFIQKENEYDLYIHIADVSHFVEPNSDLDESALERGNSYYLHETVLPMLPALLSEKLCSLVPGEDRLAFTVKATFNKDLQLAEVSFFKSIIFVDQRFTYPSANKELEKKDSYFGPIEKFCRKISTLRDENQRIRLEPNSNEALSSERIIEECMLTANTLVAAHFQQNELNTIFRCHPAITKANIDKLNSVLQLYDAPVVSYDNQAEDIINLLPLLKQQHPEIPFQYLVLRCFSLATYQPIQEGHWGLGFDHYLHFTSPIRRYADLQVHRDLFAILKQEKVDAHHLQICDKINETERVAMKAERELSKILAAIHLLPKVQDQFSVTISSVSAHRIYLYLNEYQVEGVLEPEYLDILEFIPLNDNQVSIPEKNLVLTIGEQIKVILKKVDIIHGKLYFSP